MNRIFLLSFMLVMFGTAVWGGDYQFITAKDLMQSLQKNEEMILLDIQVENEFRQHHIEGAVPTYAYPVKTEDDREKLDTVLLQIQEKEDPVVIVCPRGGGGAKRTYDYLMEKGIAEARLTILEGGQEKWPY